MAKRVTVSDLIEDDIAQDEADVVEEYIAQEEIEILEVDDIEDEPKDEKFRRIANRRAKNAIKQIRLLANCANRATYEYNGDQVNTLMDTLQQEVANLGEEFKRAMSTSRDEIDDIL